LNKLFFLGQTRVAGIFKVIFSNEECYLFLIPIVLLSASILPVSASDGDGPD